MINSDPSPIQATQADGDAAHAAARTGPKGAAVVAGIATAIVVAIWFAFYFFVFIPRGIAQ
ncbi:hypothetical protein [Microvirga puerhi]|uniref:Cytochrome c oxidase subunit 2A n=1 Tax=Microvirga puerhi TaxID=2876078 RepID=A0ABS7VUP5_9HYPH|nr:hypothetical protein [Microvirga puerhi]MBZ6078667.1 hypothetical protein [Microvirga puerhi]